jgi:hypothetical protein
MDRGDMDCVDISETVFNGYFGFCDFVSGKSQMFLKTSGTLWATAGL